MNPSEHILPIPKLLVFLCININHFQPYSPRNRLKKIGRQAFLDLINDNARSLGLHSESAAEWGSGRWHSNGRNWAAGQVKHKMASGWGKVGVLSKAIRWAQRKDQERNQDHQSHPKSRRWF